MFTKQCIVTLDMEGVLTPEIWIAVAEKTGIPELRLTTRDIQDYDELMRGRLKILERENLKLSDIQEVIGTLPLLDGAMDFLNTLRDEAQVIILSDTFQEFAYPLIKRMNMPSIFCHNLIVKDDKIVDYHLRLQDQKRKTVEMLKTLNFKVFSAGDSFNDTGMLLTADKGSFLFAPQNVTDKFPQLAHANSYKELLDSFHQFQESL